MRRALIALAVAASALAAPALGACTTTRVIAAEREVRGPEAPLGTSLRLRLPLEPGGPRFAATQTVSAQYGDISGVFQAVLEVAPSKAVVVITAAEGPRLVTLTWTRDGVKEERTFLAPDAIQGINVLADIFVSVWPLQAVRAAMPEGVTVEEDNDRMRRVKQGDRVILEVETKERNSQRLRQELRQIELGYTLKVTTEFQR